MPQLQHNFVKLLDKEQHVSIYLYTKNNSSGIPVPMIQYKVVEVKGVITEDFKKRGCWRCIKNMRCNAEQQYATCFA